MARIQFTPEQIQDLVLKQTAESKNLEYKNHLPPTGDSERKEFLADVSAFANTAGGTIIYGIEERRDGQGQATGIPERITGINAANSDLEIRRLESMIADGISPRLVGTQVYELRCMPEDRVVIIVQIARSWIGPHMVSVKGSSRFFGRADRRKFQLDINQIRGAFLAQDSIGQRWRQFRVDRVSSIIQDETPTKLAGSHRLVVHYLPIASAIEVATIDPQVLAASKSLPRPFRAGSWGGHYNFDGYCIAESHNPANSYVQFFRHGAVEAVDCSLLRDTEGEALVPKGAGKSIPSAVFEQSIFQQCEGVIKALTSVGIDYPIGLAISLLDVRGYYMGVAVERAIEAGRRIDRDHLLISEVVVTDPTEKLTAVLRPAIDAIWQATGHARSSSYDERGNWRWNV